MSEEEVRLREEIEEMEDYLKSGLDSGWVLGDPYEALQEKRRRLKQIAPVDYEVFS